MVEKPKLDQSRQVPLFTVVGLLIYVSWKIINSFPIEEWSFNDPTIALLIDIWFWTLVSFVGLKKVGIFKLLMNLAQIITNNQYSLEERLRLCMEIIQQWLGVLADVSMFVVESKKQVVEVQKAPGDPVEIIEISDGEIELVEVTVSENVEEKTEDEIKPL